MNRQLIVDEGHRNRMDLAALTARMEGFLTEEYTAAIFETSLGPIGYAMYSLQPEHVYLRHMFIVTNERRLGRAREAIQWLWQNAWKDVTRLRLDVLVGNTTGRRFWESVGFREYSVAMEATCHGCEASKLDETARPDNYSALLEEQRDAASEKLD